MYAIFISPVQSLAKRIWGNTGANPWTEIQDNPGGETQDTKRGSGKLDFFGGSDSGDAEKSAEKNVEKAKSLDTFAKPGSAKVVSFWSQPLQLEASHGEFLSNQKGSSRS